VARLPRCDLPPSRRFAPLHRGCGGFPTSLSSLPTRSPSRRQPKSGTKAKDLPLNGRLGLKVDVILGNPGQALD